MPTSPAVSRLTLLPTGPARADAGAKVKRYRLASVKPSGAPAPAPSYAYLKRMYD